jgi:hypothetical protein
MIGETAILLRLRWLVVVLFGLLWTTIDGAASLAERDHFGPSSFAAKTPAVSFSKGSPVQIVEGYDWAMLGSDEARIAHAVEK